ncbi:GNAT family N-acetyltransferase [Spirillospora sp. CA-294931]|uniref:GNAT family N-acetyltransferase n=1 Tax=Spirillospora sp. CA-294931 TaxID=3240042 RepID=UPI003D935929
MSGVALYTAATIARLPWPDTPDGRYARDYLLPLIEHGPHHAIDNVRTTLGVLLLDGRTVLPISINSREYGTSYVSSLHTHYVSYAKEELRVVEPRALRTALSLVLDGVGLMWRACQMNRVVQVNNWLLSTNLYPELTTGQVRQVTEFLRKTLPGHAIVFCSLNRNTEPVLTDECAKLGYDLVPSRQIYLARPAEMTPPRNIRKDRALLARSGYEQVPATDLTAPDLERIVELYRALYRDKYSHYNPMFNIRFVTEAHRSGTLELIALRKDGRIDGAIGYFSRKGVMTPPILGYDTSLPQSTGLYRMLTVMLFDIARANTWVRHASAGAGGFKRARGATPALEYRAVHTRHLPHHRRLAWTLLRLLLTRIAVPLTQRLDS